MRTWIYARTSRAIQSEPPENGLTCVKMLDGDIIIYTYDHRLSEWDRVRSGLTLMNVKEVTK